MAKTLDFVRLLGAWLLELKNLDYWRSLLSKQGKKVFKSYSDPMCLFSLLPLLAKVRWLEQQNKNKKLQCSLANSGGPL